MPQLQTLFGDGSAIVVGLPKKFDLHTAFRSANEIRLATAFAHRSGWNSLKPGVEASSGDVFLLTGLEYNQTEPALLKDWMHLKLSRSDKVNVSLASNKPFFHPKVLIVSTAEARFAVVGSGNMSKGGLHNNCECGVFVSNRLTVDTLSAWFDAQFAAGTPLNEQMIKAYEPDYKKARKREAALAMEQKKTEQKLIKIGEASFAKWNRALDLAETYFRDKDFNAKYTKRRKSVRCMVRYLNPPTFDFDRRGWFMFYQETALGALDPRYRDKVFKATPRLRKALLELVSNPEEAIREVLGKKGNLRINGLGENTVSKVLAANFPSDWPVYNERIATVLADFGYKAPRGAGRDGRYIAFRSAMQRFMTACKERGLPHVDAISLDAFFYDRSEELGF